MEDKVGKTVLQIAFRIMLILAGLFIGYGLKQVYDYFIG